MNAPQLLCTHCTTEKWNLAAAKYRDNRTPENYAAAVAAQREHARAVSSPALYAAAPDLLEALENALVTNFGRKGMANPETLPGWARTACAAIAKAKGEAKGLEIHYPAKYEEPHVLGSGAAKGGAK